MFYFPSSFFSSNKSKDLKKKKCGKIKLQPSSYEFFHNLKKFSRRRKRKILISPVIEHKSLYFLMAFVSFDKLTATISCISLKISTDTLFSSESFFSFLSKFTESENLFSSGSRKSNEILPKHPASSNFR